MHLSRVTDPDETPITLAEARTHVRSNGDDDDDLQAYLDAAVAHLDGADGILGCCLVTQTWEMKLDRFDGEISVPLPPLQSVESITYTDTNGATQTVSAEDYTVAGQRIVPGDGGWPDTDDVPHAVTVRFVAGYGVADDVPASIKAAIRLILGDLYANREARGEQVFDNPAAKALLRPYKRMRV